MQDGERYFCVARQLLACAVLFAAAAANTTPLPQPGKSRERKVVRRKKYLRSRTLARSRV